MWWNSYGPKPIVIFIQNILQKHKVHQIGPSGCLGGVLNKKSFVWHAKVCSTSEVNQEAILSILLLLLPWLSFSFSLFLSFFGSFFIVVPQPPSQQILFFSPSPVSPEKNGAAVVVKFFFVSSERLKIVESVGRSGEREIKKTKFSGGDEKPKNRLFHQNVTHFADCFDVESFRSVSHLQIAETISCSSEHQRRSSSLPSAVLSIYSCRCVSETKPWVPLQ